MAIKQGLIPIGDTGENLDSVQVDTAAGLDLHRETVVAADPEDPDGLGRVRNSEPAADDYATVTRVVGLTAALLQIKTALDKIDQNTDELELKADSVILNTDTLEALLAEVSGKVLTDAQLRAAAVSVDTGIIQPTTPADTQPVSASSLPLPSGASTAAKQLPDNHQVQVSNFPASFGASQVGAWAVSVDNFPAIQPISAASLPLPTGAATEAKQLPDNHQVQVSNFPASFGASQQGAWTVSVDNFPLSFGAEQVGAWSVGRTWELDFATDSVDVTGSTVAVANFPSSFGASQVGAWTVSVDNFPAVQPISATSLPLPTGAATEAKQLPDNHQVTVSNFPLVQDVDTGLDQPLTDAQLRSAPVSVDTGLTQPTTPADTQPVSVASLPLPTGAAIEAKQLPDNHQVQVSNFPAEYPLPAAQVAALTPQTDALTEAQLRTVVPDETGTWSYYAGAAGSVSVAGRVLQITATAGLVAGSLTINGGATISVPAGKSITIEPRANLSSPTVVFTGTQAYFIEVVA